MADIRTEKHYYTKDFGGYNNNEDNFVAEQEITVTITLSEYRKLIKENAVSDKEISKKNSELYDLERKHRELNDEMSKLKEKLFDLQEERNTLRIQEKSLSILDSDNNSVESEEGGQSNEGY